MKRWCDPDIYTYIHGPDHGNGHRKIPESAAKSALKDETKKPPNEQPAILSFLAGCEGEIELLKKLIKIGKDSTCDIVVGGMMVGRTAATISRRPTGYFLSFASGMSKPKVNGVSVKESVKLEEFDTIEIAGVKLQFVFQK